MPKRFNKFLDNMDTIRDESEEKVNEMLLNIDIDKLIQDPEMELKKNIILFLSENNGLFKKARVEGIQLVKSLKQ